MAETEMYVVRTVHMTAPTERITGPFATNDQAWAWLDAHREGLAPYFAPQIMPLSEPSA